MTDISKFFLATDPHGGGVFACPPVSPPIPVSGFLSLRDWALFLSQ